MKRFVSIYQVLDEYTFIDVTNRYRVKVSNTGGTLHISSDEPLFTTVLSTFQTDNYFTVVIRYLSTKVCISIEKVNDLCKSEVFTVENTSQNHIRVNIREVPYLLNTF